MLKTGGNPKQSRLLQMREEYQQRVLKEKEEKLVHMYEEGQRRAQDRAQRVTKGSSPNAYPNSRLQPPGVMQQHYQLQAESSSSVRDFFRERRELESKGSYVPPIEHHYRRTRNGLRENSDSGKTRKSSAGVDRAHPLAPIQERHSAPADSPFGNRPRMVKPRGTQRDDNNNEMDKTADIFGTPQSTPAAAGVGPNPRSVLKKPPQTVVGTSKRSPGQKEEKLSDFQKWQLQQAQAREERLKKLNTRVPQSGRDSRGFETSAKENDDEEEEDDDEIARKQRQLMEKIARQQAELDHLKKQREKEEEQERQEAERQRKQEAAERERLRRRQQQEEAREKREGEEAFGRAARAQQRHLGPAGSDDDENDRNDDGSNHPAATKTARRAPEPSRKPAVQQPRPAPPKAQKGGQASRREASPEEEPTPAPGPDVDFYAQRALDEDAVGGRVKLVLCRLCGRKFAEDRVRKHQDACKVSQKKRKVFDPVLMRTDGTEMAKYISKGAHKKDHPNKKKNWRAEHENFVESIRYAKKVAKMEQEGVAPRDLPPPPPSLNPDLVPCPHCGRSFNEAAAARHIPRCKDLKTKPAPKRR